MLERADDLGGSLPRKADDRGRAITGGGATTEGGAMIGHRSKPT